MHGKNTSPTLQVVESPEEMFVYPYGISDVLSPHNWYAFNHNAYLTSTLYLRGSLMVRAVAQELFHFSQQQRPIGTLPCDEEELAALTRISYDEWENLRAQRINQLHNWTRCVTLDGIECLYHPIVLESVKTAFQFQSKRDRTRTKDTDGRRLRSLRETIAKCWSDKSVLEDDAFVSAVEAHLRKNVEGYWTEVKVKDAINIIIG